MFNNEVQVDSSSRHATAYGIQDDQIRSFCAFFAPAPAWRDAVGRVIMVLFRRG